VLPKKVFHHARAINVGNGKGIIFSNTLKNAKHLRSIIVNHVLSTQVLTAIFQIKNLKYLEISLLLCEALPEAISGIWSLQAMRLWYSDLLKLPKSIGKLQKLRTLSLSWCWNLECLPDSIGGCEVISSIDLCDCRKFTVLPNSIGRNKRLKVLKLGNTKIEMLPSSITTLRNLEYLDLHGCQELVELPEGISNLQKLQVLDIKDCRKLEGMPIGIGHLNRLQKLDLFVVGEG
jgi:Leucine-rich repeat (LRR) protein